MEDTGPVDDGAMDVDGPRQPGVRAQRRIMQANSEQYVVKMGLDKALVPSEQKAAIMQELCQRVEAASRAHRRLSVAVNLLVRTCLQDVTDWTQATLPPFLTETKNNATFAYQLTIGLEAANKPLPLVRNFLQAWNARLPPSPTRFPGDRNSLVRMAEQYMTNYRTYLSTHFSSRQKRYLYEWADAHDFAKETVRSLAAAINGWSVPEPGRIANDPCQALIRLHRAVLGLDVGAAVTDVWFKKRYERVVVYFAMMSRYMEQREKKAFVLAPLARIRAAFLHVDTDVLFGVMKRLKLYAGKMTDFRELRDAQWGSVIQYHLPWTRRQARYASFTGTIQTDGVSVCIHYMRPKRAPSSGPVATLTTHGSSAPVKTVAYQPMKGDRQLGADPGRVHLLTLVEMDDSGKYKTYRLSRSQYYAEAGFTRAQQRSQVWQSRIQPVLVQRATLSSKATSLAAFLAFLDLCRDTDETLWGEFLKRRWARQRLRTYAGKSSCLERFLASLDDGSGRRVVIGYGDAAVACTGRGERSVPMKDMYRRCARRYETVAIDEFRTSKVHWQTDEVMRKVETRYRYRDKDGRVKVQRVEVRGLRWCSSTSGGKFVDRDVNAALNMLRCLRNLPDRPVALQRGGPAVPMGVFQLGSPTGPRQKRRRGGRRRQAARDGGVGAASPSDAR